MTAIPSIIEWDRDNILLRLLQSNELKSHAVVEQ